MRLLRLIPIFLAAAVLGAHFLRIDNYGAMTAVCIAPLLLFIPRRWAAVVVQMLLITAAVFWFNVLVFMVKLRQELEAPWGRLAAILVTVALLTAASALLLRRPYHRRYYRHTNVSTGASIIAFWLTALLLSIVQLKVSLRMLLAERFWLGGGWLTILALSTYAAWITEKMLDTRRSARWRSRIWAFFSIVFFLQLTVGLAGVDQMLMTGDLHLPVPAMIVGGPIFRGGGLFMLILFGVTVLLVGPAWCSHLCYVGAWDNSLASRKRRPAKRLGRWQPWLRVVTLFVVICGALLLRELGASMFVAGVVAAWCGLAFGLLGVVLMAVWSRRTGTMAHCSWYCPIGLLATVLGRLSPHRMRLTDTCVDCGRCSYFCRYDALRAVDIERRRPGLSCTLCGDCLGSCRQGSIEYRLFGLSADKARVVFITLVVSLHAVFIGVARI